MSTPIITPRIACASALAAIVVTSAASSAVAAPDRCFASPNRLADAGHHWNYRIDRATKQRCWYQRRVGGVASAARPADNSTAATTSNPSDASSWLSSIVSNITGSTSTGSTVAAPAQSAPTQQTSGTEGTEASRGGQRRARSESGTRSDGSRRKRIETAQVKPLKPESGKLQSARTRPAPSPASESSFALPLDAEKRDALFRDFEQWRRRNAICSVMSGGAASRCEDAGRD